MYAILRQGGRQYTVAPGDHLVVDRIPGEVGSVVTLEPVLLVHGDDAPVIGMPAVADARVTATVVAHRRGRKLLVFKYKPKKRYRRIRGYRSELTELRVDAVLTAREGGKTASTSATTPRRRTSSTKPKAQSGDTTAEPRRRRTASPPPASDKLETENA